MPGFLKFGSAGSHSSVASSRQSSIVYAYLIQLVGCHVWRSAWLRMRDADVPISITTSDAHHGIDMAMDEFETAVLETAISDLPKTCIDFILVMSELPQVCSVRDIAARLERTTGYLSPYRRKLIFRQVIEQTAPGYVTFSIPFMREYLAKEKTQILSRYGE